MTAADGRVLRGARGGPLSKAATAGSGTRPAAPRPRRARRACVPTTCVMLRCRCGWPPVPRPPKSLPAPGHTVRVLLTVYAHGMPGCDQIASQHIEEALNPSRWPPAGPRTGADPGNPIRHQFQCHSWTQQDTTEPGAPTPTSG